MFSTDDWFEYHRARRPRLWTHTPAAMEKLAEVLNEDRLAHANTPHVFAIPF